MVNIGIHTPHVASEHTAQCCNLVKFGERKIVRDATDGDVEWSNYVCQLSDVEHLISH